MRQALSLHVRHRTDERPGALLVALAAAILALAVVATPAAAGGGMSTWPADDPTSERFHFSIGLLSCEEPDYAVTQDTDPVDADLDVQAQAEPSHGGDWNISGTFSVTDLDAGQYQFEADCPGDEGVSTSSFYFNRLTVDKQVEGDVPGDAEFVISVECNVEPNGSPGDGFALELTYPAAGGSDSVLPPAGSVCDVEETDDGGADSVTVSNGQALFFGAGNGETTTVINTFPVAEEPEAEEPDEEEDVDVEEVDADEEEAEPAEPVEAEPDYTG